MLLRYFGFDEEPFGATPDPRCLYPSSMHREALASLKYGFQSNRGFTALIAPPGMGKTTLLFRFLEEIRESAQTVFLFDIDHQAQPRDLAGFILRDIGINPGANLAEMHQQLKGFMVAQALAGRKFVVVIDEAQNLSDALLERVRLFTNFETPQTKLVQVVLAGQPQLSDKLMRPSLLQLRQRISTICRLEPFSTEEALAYIAHRLKVAGYHGESLFEEDALGLIVESSHGIPRNINTLCFNALSICCAMKRKRVDRSMVAEANADQQLVHTRKPIETAAVNPRGRSRQPHRPKRRAWLAWTAMLLTSAAVFLLAAFEPGVIGLSEGRFLWHRDTGGQLALNAKLLPAPVKAMATIHDTSHSASLPSTQAPPRTSDTSIAEQARHTAPFEIVVEPHQSLADIAVMYLGSYNSARLRQIQRLNPKLADPDHILVGQKILLPASAETLVAIDGSTLANVRSLP